MHGSVTIATMSHKCLHPGTFSNLHDKYLFVMLISLWQ